MSIGSLTYINKAYLGDITATNIYKRFTHKMAAKTSWHRCGTKLRHCQPTYRAQKEVNSADRNLVGMT